MASYRPFPPPPPLSQPHLPPPIPNPNHHHQHFPPNPNPNYYNQLPFAPPPPQSYYPPPPPPPNAPPPPPDGPPPPPPGAPPMHPSAPPMPAAVPPNRRAETEEERRARKKREYEKQKAMERQKLALKQSQAHVLQKTKTAAAAAAGVKAGAHVHPQEGHGRHHHHHGASGSKVAADKHTARLLSSDHRMIETNRLKKPSTFICKLRFRNELPDPTAQPKLLPLNTDKDRYTKYAITSLEKNYKPKYYPEPDIGIPLDLLDLSVYNPPADRPLLDPEDEELLRDTEVATTPVKRDGIRIKERPTDKGVSWLVKTQYISPLSMDSARQSLTEKQAKELREAKEGKNIFLENLNSREKQIQAIEESFKAAKLPPVHQSNRSLKPVEILPLLPDLNRYDDQLVVVGFDGDPTADSEAYNKVDKSIRDELESQAIMKSFVVNGSDPSKHEKFLAYMVPGTDELSKNIYDEDEDVTYSWLREYHWDVRGDDTGDPNTYLVNFGDKDARYLPLPTKLVLQKKRAKEGRTGDEIEHYPVPSRITVRKRSTVAVHDHKESGTSSNYKKARYSEQYESNSRHKIQRTGSIDQFDGDEDMSD